MNDNQTDETKDELPEEQPEQKNFMTHFYIALGCFITGCVLLALSIIFTFAVKNGVAVYFLISSMIAELASVSFLNAMKQRGGEGKLRTVFVILSYVIMGVALAILIAGTGTSIFVKNNK